MRLFFCFLPPFSCSPCCGPDVRSDVVCCDVMCSGPAFSPAHPPLHVHPYHINVIKYSSKYQVFLSNLFRTKFARNKGVAGGFITPHEARLMEAFTLGRTIKLLAILDGVILVLDCVYWPALLLLLFWVSFFLGSCRWRGGSMG